MYIVVDKKEVKTVNGIVNRLIRIIQFDSIYYDSDLVRPTLDKPMDIVKEADLFSAMLGCDSDNCLYIISTAKNKQNPMLGEYMKEVI